MTAVDATEKLGVALRAIGKANTLVDEDATHWLIMTTVEQLDAPIKVHKDFVQCARQREIEDVLREKFAAVED